MLSINCSVKLSDYLKEKNMVESKKSYKFYISFLTLILVIINGTVFRSSVLGLLSAFFGLFLFLDPQYLIPIVFASGALNASSFIFGNFTASRYFALLFIFAGIVKAFGQKKVKYLIFMYLIGYGSYCAVSAVASSNGASESVLTLLINVMTAMFIMFVPYDKMNDVFKLLFICGMLMIAAMIVIYLRGDYTVSVNRYELVEDVNNNSVAISISQTAILLLGTIFVIKDLNKFLKYLAIAFVAAGAFIVFILGSRSGFGGVAAAIAVGMFMYIRISPSKTRSIAIILTVIVVIILIVPIILSFFPELMDRFTFSNIEETGGSGRFDIWGTVFKEVILKYPIFGVGFGGHNIRDILFANEVYHGGTHNMYLDIFAQLGLVGGLYFFVGLFYLMIKDYVWARRNRAFVIPLLLLVGLLINGFGENIHASRPFWFAVMLSVWFNISDEIKNEKTLAWVDDTL